MRSNGWFNKSCDTSHQHDMKVRHRVMSQRNNRRRLKRTSHTVSSLPPLTCQDGTIVIDSKAKAEVLSKILAANSTIDVKCAAKLAPLLSRLFQICYESGTFPGNWKIYPYNYRPIALLSKCINHKLLDQLERQGLMSDTQYGFRHQRSIRDLLVYVTLLWSKLIQSHGEALGPLQDFDESRFCLGMHDGRARVRRRRGERRNPQFFVERHVHHTVGVMVWGVIAYGSRSSLIFIRGNMNAQHPTFQQDNARSHVARVTIDFFQHNDVTLLPWPPRSPDLSPIELVLLNLQRPPQTLEALREELVVAWNEIPQEDIDHLIRSMPRCVGECVAYQGASTHY
ncbi:unnamed protein product [Acanthoscelides obtectus]|uniref:Reverse transcriptase domain-containing protein n=1 Tax=Acanthoscelides obtectus TaxID=200917 RepID=A0A9P0M495_ACAOB|nr:unnamed protein product [Acanthoscelides obtectus]CAK1670377.1 Transposable element Tc3 transposase [Acanthoscelides obtectus]